MTTNKVYPVLESGMLNSCSRCLNVTYAFAHS